MFGSSKKKEKKITAMSLLREVRDLEKLCFSALQIDANLMSAFDYRFNARLDGYLEKLRDVEKRVEVLEALNNLGSAPPSSVTTETPYSPLSELGAAGGEPRDEGVFTFEASFAPLPRPPRPPRWSESSIEAFLARGRSGRTVSNEDDRREWYRLVQTITDEDTASGKLHF